MRREARTHTGALAPGGWAGHLLAASERTARSRSARRRGPLPPTSIASRHTPSGQTRTIADLTDRATPPPWISRVRTATHTTALTLNTQPCTAVSDRRIRERIRAAQARSRALVDEHAVARTGNDAASA